MSSVYITVIVALVAICLWQRGEILSAHESVSNLQLEMVRLKENWISLDRKTAKDQEYNLDEQRSAKAGLRELEQAVTKQNTAWEKSASGLEKKIAEQENDQKELRSVKKQWDDLSMRLRELQLDVSALKKETHDVTTIRQNVATLVIKMNDVQPKVSDLTTKVNRLAVDDDDMRRNMFQFKEDIERAMYALRERNPVLDVISRFFDWITRRSNIVRKLLN